MSENPKSPCDRSETKYYTDQIYKVTFRTADVKDAGTDSNISIRLFGTCRGSAPDGGTNWIEVNALISGDAFTRGDSDELILTRALTQDVGPVEKIELHHDGLYDGPAWRMDYINIEYLPVPGTLSTFRYPYEIDDTTLTLTRTWPPAGGTIDIKTGAEEKIEQRTWFEFVDNTEGSVELTFEIAWNMNLEKERVAGKSIQKTQTSSVTSGAGLEIKGVFNMSTEVANSLSNQINQSIQTSVQEGETYEINKLIQVPPHQLLILKCTLFKQVLHGTASRIDGGTSIDLPFTKLKGFSLEPELSFFTVDQVAAGEHWVVLGKEKELESLIKQIEAENAAKDAQVLVHQAA